MSSSSSARLKRRAENEPELLSKTNLNESFVTVGTALPSLASTRKDQGEYVPIWKQEVRDEKGRRRLHGAFTGGFSAGYFNTVGSKEGWAPSTFVSSRNAGRDGGPAAANAGARPEDFMDEEDLAELKASRGFKTSDEYGSSTGSGAFAGEGRPRAGLGADPSYSSAVENSLNDLVKPGTNRIGEKIMMKMGWRPGQGVGPRLSHSRRKEVLKDLGIARAPPEDNDDEVDDSEEAKKHMYAPVDRPLVTFDGKENQMGLGYLPGRTLDQSLSAGASSSHASTSRAGLDAYETSADSHTAGLPRGGAFGISALEDADEDDDDIYSSGPGGSLSGSRGGLTLHDEEEDDEPAFGARRRPELLQYQDRSKLRGSQSTARVRQAAPKTDLQKFSDGTPVVPGFVLADKAQPPDKWFPAPSVPKGWQPNPKAVIERDRIKAASNPDGIAPNAAGTPTAGQKGKMNMLTADDRANMLGEPVAPKSVFDYLSSKNKERLAHLPPPDSKSSTNGGAVSKAAQQAGSAPSSQTEVDTTVKIPSIETRIAQGALKGFMPYGDDLARQARYRSYLTHAAAPYDSQYSPRPLPGSTIAELNRELADFASAAMIFKPMTGLMANRFTSGTAASVLQAPTPGLSVPVPKAAAILETDLATEGAEAARKQKEQDDKDKQDPRRAAARAGDFGPLTRTVTPFYPARLLCKRFNVPDPHPEGPANSSTAHDAMDSATGQEQSSAPASDVLDQGVMDQILRDRTAGSGTRDAPATTVSGEAAVETDALQKEAAMPTLATVGLGEDEYQGRDTLTYKKPPMDIFKAIFADSDDDDSDEEDEPNALAGASSSKKPDEQSTNSALSAASVKPVLKPPEIVTPVPVTVDSMASFKPTFVSKSDRSTADKQENGKDKKAKKKVKKSSAVVSFELEDGEGAADSVGAPKETKSKKRKAEEKERKVKKEKKANGQMEAQAGEEEDEWVEKEAPASAAVPPSAHGGPNGHTAPRGQRVRASELF